MLAPRLARLLADTSPRNADDPAYLAIARGVQLLIIDGRIPADVRLPSERSLAVSLSVSRATVTKAYDSLRRYGFATSRQGSGTLAALPLGRRGTVDHLLAPVVAGRDVVDLVTASPAASPGVADAYRVAFEQLPLYLCGHGFHPSGLPVLQEILADRYTRRGLPTSPTQVLIVNGALSGIAVVARSLVRTGDRVVLESPTYPNAIAVWQGVGARPVATAVDRVHGWDVTTLASTLRQTAARVCYLIPEFHNPTGHVMSNEDRAALAESLLRHDVTAVIDETLIDTGIEAADNGSRPAPFASFAQTAYTVGSASKTFWGGLHVGWIRAPMRAADLVASRLQSDLGTPVVEQLAVAHLLRHDNGDLVHRRRVLGSSRDVLVTSVRKHLANWKVRVPDGGQVLWCELPDERSSALAHSARRHGLALAPGPSFAPEGGLDRFIRLPFTATDNQLRDVGPTLARALADTTNDPLARWPTTPLIV